MTCPECKESSPIEDRRSGAILCSGCGLVLDLFIDDSAEWRSFDEDFAHDTKNRVGEAASIYDDNELSTTVSGDGSNLSRAHSAITNRPRANVHHLEHNIELLRLSDMVKQVAHSFYEQYRKLKSRVANVEVDTVACIFMACSHCGAPRSLRELANETKVDFKQLRRGVARVSRLVTKPLPEPQSSVATIGNLVRRYGSVLHLPNHCVHKALEIASQAPRTRQPATIAAAAILLSSEMFDDVSVSRTEIARVSCVGESTIRDCCRDFRGIKA